MKIHITLIMVKLLKNVYGKHKGGKDLRSGQNEGSETEMVWTREKKEV